MTLDGRAVCDAHDSANPAPTAPLVHFLRRGQMIELLAAPLAQLAEQLALNQGESLANAEENGTSNLSEAPGAAVGAEIGAALGDASRRLARQGTTPSAGAEVEMAEVLNRWASLPVAIRMAVLAMARAVG